MAFEPDISYSNHMKIRKSLTLFDFFGFLFLSGKLYEKKDYIQYANYTLLKKHLKTFLRISSFFEFVVSSKHIAGCSCTFIAFLSFYIFA